MTQRLGHVTRKIVSEMTYNVSSGTLNPTIQYPKYLPLNVLFLYMARPEKSHFGFWIFTIQYVYTF